LPFHSTKAARASFGKKLLALQLRPRAAGANLLVSFVIEANPGGILAGVTEVKFFKSGPVNGERHMGQGSHWKKSRVIEPKCVQIPAGIAQGHNLGMGRGSLVDVT